MSIFSNMRKQITAKLPQPPTPSPDPEGWMGQQDTPAPAPYMPTIMPSTPAPTPAPAPTSTPSTPAFNPNDPQGWFNSIRSGVAPTQEGLRSLMPTLQSAGWKLGNPNAAGYVDSVIGPGGQVIDVLKGATAGGGTGSWQWGAWEGAGDWAANGGGGSAPFGGTGGGMAGGIGGPYDKRISDSIDKLLARGFAPPTADDPTLKAQFDPISRTMERGARRSREAAAERAAVSGQTFGGSGGGLDSDIGSINEELAGKEGELMSGLVGDELKGRRQDIMMALEAASGEQSLKLRQMLADVDAAIARESLGQQDRHFYDDMGYKIGRDQFQFERMLDELEN